VPQGTELQDSMLRFRKQVELAFSHESNQLDSLIHKKVPVRTTERVQSFFIMRDMFRLIKRMIRRVSAALLPKDHAEKIKKLQKMQIEQLSLLAS
jgi:hypothetical protein